MILSLKPQGFYRYERQKEELNPFPGAKIGLEKLKLGAHFREQGAQNFTGGIRFYWKSIPNRMTSVFVNELSESMPWAVSSWNRR